MGSERLGRRLDLAGGALAGAAVGWTFVSAASGGGTPVPVATLIGASAVVVALSRLAATFAGRWLVPAGIVAVALAVAVLGGDLLSRSPLQGPFGYANAAGAFFVQAAVAGLMLAAATASAPARIFGAGACIAFAAVPFMRDAVAAAAVVALLPVVFLARAPRQRKILIASWGALVAVALSTTILLGGTFEPGPAAGPVERSAARLLSERRLELWHDALQIMREHPWGGVGPGRFREVSATALADRDAAWAHSGFLQQGAEQGVVGLALIVLFVVWAFARLLAVSAPDLVTVLGAVSVGSLGLLASIDYVLHFPAVPLAAAALLGTAIAGTGRTAARGAHVDRAERWEGDGIEISGS